MKNVGRQLIWMVIVVVSAGASALDNPTQMSFDGVLLDGSNAPITTPTSVRFQLFNPAADCLLFEETQTVTPSSNGTFTAIIGTPANRASAGVDGGLSWKTIFSNKGSLRAAASPGCSPGYTPATTDGRKLRVTVAGNVLSPDFSVSSTPFATTADTLQGYQPADFLSNLGGSLTGFLKMDSQNQIRFADAGNTNYIALSAPASIGGNYSFTLPASYGTNGQVLTSNGAGGLSWTSPAGGGLPLAGGTMTGAIAMGGNNITATGHITMSAQTTLNLGTYSTAQEATLVGGLTGADKGKTWFNSTSNTMMYWDGSAAQVVAAGSGITALTGDVTASGAGAVSATIANNAVSTLKIANDAVTSAKLNSTGIAINRLLITDAITGVQVKYADTCAFNEVLKWSAAGWVCAADANSDAVTSVASRTGAITLSTADIAGLGSAATLNAGSGPNNLVQLNGSSKIANTLLNPDVLLGTGNSAGTIINVGTNDAYALNLRTNGLSRVTVSPAGDVGIGTTTPAAPLQVGYATAAANMAAIFSGKIQAANSNSGVVMPIQASNTFNNIGDGAGVELQSGSNPNAQAAIVGIIENTAPANGKFQILTLSSNTLTPKITILSNGYMGVGNTTPAERLDILGNAKLSGDLLLGNSGNPTCNVSNEGAVRYDNPSKSLELCNGTSWILVPMASVSSYAGNYLDSAVMVSTTYYAPAMGSFQINGGTPSTTDYSPTTRTVMSRTGVLKNLVIKTNVNPGSAWVFSVLKNGTPTGVTCTISGSNICSDNINSVPVAPGDEIGMKIQTGTSGASTRSAWAFELISP